MIITDNTWLKVKLTKVDDVFLTLDNFSRNYWEGDLQPGYSKGITERYWTKSREVKVDGYKYKLGLMVDLTTKSGYAMIRLQVTLRDINDCFCYAAIDLNNKNWPDFALSIRDAYHYLCGRQIEYTKSNTTNNLQTA
jgi:hypothetical protein